MTVTNAYGTTINFEAAIELMDDEIREQLHAEGIESQQAFFDAYEAAHLAKFGEAWLLSEPNPQY